MHGVICTNSVFEYKDWTFEVHSYHGPTPLNRYGELIDDIPDRFWDVYDEFSVLSTEEKNKYRTVEGGCHVF